MNPALFSTTLTTVASIVALMAILAALEHALATPSAASARRAITTNLALSALTLALNGVFNTAVWALLVWQDAQRIGLLATIGLPTALAMVVVVVGLDFATWVAHVAMHTSPRLWRIHRVHHADPWVDVTTTLRQHPLEGAVRYAFIGATSALLGAPPAAFAIYRTWSVLHGLLEHADLRLPRGLDAAVSHLLATPDVHKVHHSREARETDTNYGNIFSVFDRAFGSFTPPARARRGAYGLAEFADASTQTTRHLLGLPFRA